MKSICAVEGVEAAGIREGKYGLAIIKASGNAAAVFTRNLFAAEPVLLMKERIGEGNLDGIICNSGNANVYTAETGRRDAVRMSEIAAEAIGSTPERIGVASTGVIGRFLDLPLIESQCRAIAPMLRSDESAEDDVARAIMTTDTVEKHAIARRKSFTVAGIAKGSGMIAPDMGTMLAFIYTDAAMPAEELRESLVRAVDRSFNRVVVDGDTSTNDCVFLTATARRGKVAAEDFSLALEEVCSSLARQIAADGEGATKLIEVTVKGAPSEDDAAEIARTIVGSSLVKTAVYGEDPNWGRIIAAAGRAGVDFDPRRVSVYISEGDRRVMLADRGEIVAEKRINPAALEAAQRMMRGETVSLTFDMNAGEASATAWGCDLTEKYVEINGKYTT